MLGSKCHHPSATQGAANQCSETCAVPLGYPGAPIFTLLVALSFFFKKNFT